jgi:D-beta-D-heptose 7-phosphate kinase/D-beta-D-heptose 1-phosphate adenosyltransferase
VLSRNEIGDACSKLRQSGKRIVFTNGCFDILHAGHLESLRIAGSFGDALVVGLNSDESVTRLKGPGRPLMNEDDRAELLAALECVDIVSIFDEETPLELIKQVRPDVLVKGGDYGEDEVVGRDFVVSTGGRLEIVPLRSGYSTRGLIKRIVERFSGADSEG